jgi:ATP-dependent protease Clp ATPase subunit
LRKVNLEFKDEAIVEIAKKAISKKNWSKRFKVDLRKYFIEDNV